MSDTLVLYYSTVQYITQYSLSSRVGHDPGLDTFTSLPYIITMHGITGSFKKIMVLGDWRVLNLLFADAP